MAINCKWQSEPEPCMIDTSDCHSTGNMERLMMCRKCNDPTEYPIYGNRSGKICYKGCICADAIHCKRRILYDKESDC